MVLLAEVKNESLYKDECVIKEYFYIFIYGESGQFAPAGIDELVT